MPVFNAQIVQRVTKVIDAGGNERVIVDRIIAEVSNVVALDNNGAAAIVGRKIPTDYDHELLSQAMVRVQKTAE